MQPERNRPQWGRRGGVAQFLSDDDLPLSCAASSRERNPFGFLIFRTKLSYESKKISIKRMEIDRN